MNAATAFEGGIESPRWIIVTLLVLVSTLLGGIRTGMIWAGICVVTVVARFKLTQAGVASEQLLDPNEALTHQLSSLLAATVFTFVVARVYENTKVRMFDALEGQRHQVQQAHQDVRVILDNAGQGFFTLDRSGALCRGWSAIAVSWLGQPEPGMRFGDYLSGHDRLVGELFDVGWEQVEDGLMPVDVALAQLPSHLQVGDFHFSMRYEPVLEPGSDQLEKVVVIVSDETLAVERERADSRQRDLQSLLGQFIRDRAATREFAQSVDVTLIEMQASNGALLRRDLHTLKGTCAIMGLLQFAQLCHRVETQLDEDGADTISIRQLKMLRGAWADLRTASNQFLRDSRDGVFLDSEAYSEFLEAIGTDIIDREILREWVQLWSYEPGRNRLGRFAVHAKALATRLGLGDIDVEVDSNGLYVDSTHLTGFWSAATHLIRNAVDHGLRRPEGEAAQAGERGLIRFELDQRDDMLWLHVSNNGPGVDWLALAAKAKARQLPASTRADLIDALFSDGFSTRDTVTETSGRGVGLAAVRQAVDELNGEIRVVSDELLTRFSLGVPRHRVRFGARPELFLAAS